VSDTYTKLFSSITESTVWGEAYATRIVWVTMLAMADAQGNVYGAVPGLARRANVTLQEVEAALAAFLAPDPYSRTKDDDGRRIEEIDGGWRLINHGKYKGIRGADERKEYKRQWDRDHRPSGHQRAAVRQQSDSSPTKPDSPAPPTPTPDLKEQEQKSSARQAERFADWWAVYPKKVKRKDAESLWARRKFDVIADQLIADVLNRTANDDGWQRGYVPDPTTYLNQERWNDEVRAAPTARAGPPAAASPSKALLAMQKIQGVKHGLAGNRTEQRPDEAGIPRLVVDAKP
jgi:hypothetical protein